MKRHWKVLTVWIVITLAVAALIGSLEAFKDCIHEHKDHEAYRSIYEDNSVFVKAIVRLQLHASCGVYAAHKNESPLVAFFTLLISGFTFKKCRWTKFRIHISEEGNFHRRIISSATEGNDAT